MRLWVLGVVAASSWLAAAPASAADVDGDWQMVFQTEVGPRETPLNVTTDGETATAVMGETQLAGTYKDGLLELSGEHYAADAGYTATLTIKARMDGPALTGEWIWSEYSSVFEGKRPAE